MNSQLSLILNEVKKRNWSYAESLCWGELKKNPNDFLLNKVLALCLLMQKKYMGATEKYEFLLKKNEDDYDVLNNLSNVYLAEEKFVEANSLINLCISKYPDKFHAYIHKAELLFKQRNFESAIKNLQIVFEIIGDESKISKNNDLVQLYGDLLIATDKVSEAAVFVKRNFDYHGDSFLFYYLMTIDPNIYDEASLKEIIANFEKENYLSLTKKNLSLSQVYFGAARFYEKKDKEKSESYYIKANELSSLIQRYKPLEHQKIIKNIKNYYLKNHNQKFVDENCGEGLIFVLGMPRSGTSLVESIIASNQDVFSGGELISIPLLLEKYFDNDDLTEPDIAKVSKNYIKRVEFLKNNQNYFLDKLPANFFHIWLISMALPKAKFIHIERDPWDTAISLFKQLYISNVPFASKFFTIACHIANYRHIMDFWLQKLSNDKILTVRYEDIVSEKETYSQKIFDFLGLKNNKDLHEREKFFSRTASKLQVREGIHGKSIKKSDFSVFRDDFLETLNNQRRYWEMN